METHEESEDTPRVEQPQPVADPDTEATPVEATVDVETLVENAVAKALKGLAEKIEEAEERGYQRAVSEARRQVEEMRRVEESHCNFLVSSRHDIWNS